METDLQMVSNHTLNTEVINESLESLEDCALQRDFDLIKAFSNCNLEFDEGNCEYRFRYCDNTDKLPDHSNEEMCISENLG